MDCTVTNKISREELNLALDKLNYDAQITWRISSDKLHKKFTFKDFKTAFEFMTQSALVAESMDHHPEWFNVYNKVIVDLTTHDTGGISAKDFELAGAMEEIAKKVSA